MDIELLIATGSYAAIFLLMTLNGAASIPSSQILYIVVGYFIAKGNLTWIPAIVLGATGNTLGNIILYEIVRKYGRNAVLKYRMFDPNILAKVEVAVQQKGWWFLFIGKLLPAIKVFIPIPAGLGQMHRGGYIGIMFLASTIWASVFIFFGYLFGKSFKIFGWYGISITLVAGIVVFFFFRYVNNISLPEKKSENSIKEP